MGNNARNNRFFACSKMHLAGNQPVVPEFGNGFFN